MSQASIPNITPLISITTKQSATLLLSSIALEEIALAHIINSEAEKIQFVLGTLDSSIKPPMNITIANVLEINQSVHKTMQDVIMKEILLQIKFTHVLDLLEKLRSEDQL